MLVGRAASISSLFLGMLVLSAKPALAHGDVSSQCYSCRVTFRSPCQPTSWTCTGIRVCHSKVFPSATPARPTCPTSKGNTPVSSGKTRAGIVQDIPICFSTDQAKKKILFDCEKFDSLRICTRYRDTVLFLVHFLFSPTARGC